MKKLFAFLLPVLIMSGFLTSCSKEEIKQDIQQANQATAKADTMQIASIKMEEYLASPEARESQAATCLPKSLIPEVVSLTVYGIPATQFGVPKVFFEIGYRNRNQLAGQIKIQIRTKGGIGRLITVGPYALDPTGTSIGEFTTAEPFFPEDFPIKVERVVTAIPGCNKSNFYYPSVPVIIPLPQ